MSGTRFSVFKIDGKFSNGYSHAMIDFGKKDFPNTIVTLFNKVCSRHKDKLVTLATYSSPDRAEEVRAELLEAYKMEKDYYLPEEGSEVSSQ